MGDPEENTSDDSHEFPKDRPDVIVTEPLGDPDEDAAIEAELDEVRAQEAQYVEDATDADEWTEDYLSPTPLKDEWRDPLAPPPRYVYCNPAAGGAPSFALDYMPPAASKINLALCWVVVPTDGEPQFRRPRRGEQMVCAHTGLPLGRLHARHVRDLGE